MNNGDKPISPVMTQSASLQNECSTGLTKREYFAAKAMQGIVSSIDSEENYLRLKSHANSQGLNVSAWIAKDAVKQSDALLAELDKTNQP